MELKLMGFYYLITTSTGKWERRDYVLLLKPFCAVISGLQKIGKILNFWGNISTHTVILKCILFYTVSILQATVLYAGCGCILRSTRRHHNWWKNTPAMLLQVAAKAMYRSAFINNAHSDFAGRRSGTEVKSNGITAILNFAAFCILRGKSSQLTMGCKKAIAEKTLRSKGGGLYSL